MWIAITTPAAVELPARSKRPLYPGLRRKATRLRSSSKLAIELRQMIYSRLCLAYGAKAFDIEQVYTKTPAQDVEEVQGVIDFQSKLWQLSINHRYFDVDNVHDLGCFA